MNIPAKVCEDIDDPLLVIEVYLLLINVARVGGFYDIHFTLLVA
jgi:hypothetical protein